MHISKKTFCSAPWFQIRNENNGYFRSCCEIDHTKTQFQGRTDYQIGKDSLSDWLTSEYVQYLRKELTQGHEISECEKCWQKERNGLKSLRQIINHSTASTSAIDQSWIHAYLKNKTDYTGDFLVSADIKISNICNFSCAMCNPMASTQIYAIWNKDKHHPMVQYAMKQDPDILDNARTVFLENINSNIDFLKQVLDQDIKHLKILGGEPLLDDRMLSVLAEIDKEKSKKISLLFVTNGSVDLTDVQHRLKNFKSVMFVLSLEGIGELQTYVRRGSDWKSIENNVKKYIKYHGTKDLYVSYTLQALTILDLPDLIGWCEDHDIALNINVLTTPDYLSIKSVPNALKQKIIEIFENCQCKIIPPPLQNEPYITFSGLINLLKETQWSSEMTVLLKRFLDWYDPRSDWKQLLPEWAPYL